VRVGSPAHRCIALLVALAVLFGLVLVRLVNLQVVSPDHYAAAGAAQRLREKPIAAERGSIFDRNGYELAMSVAQKTVWADPRAVKDVRNTAGALAPLLGIEEDVLREKLSQDGAFVYLARQIPVDVAAKVDALELAGISSYDESKRFEPGGLMARSVIGDVNLDNVGRSGLESLLNGSLVGTPGKLQVEQGPDGRTIAGGRQHLEPAVRGNDLVLTIDRALQFEVERALIEQVVASNAQNGMAIVMDPTTGEILAMANVGLDDDGKPVPSSDNKALTVAFEPGSVNKVITVAGALEEGLMAPDTVLEVPDRISIAGFPFSDHDPHPPTRWNVTDILTQSSNIGTIKIAQQLGVTKVKEYLQKFGLGQPTGLDFPGETAGVMKTGRWDATDIGSIPIGQGVSVNALQMLQVFNTLANGGVWVEPHLVKAVVDDEGKETKPAAPATRRVVSSETAKQMTAMMENVVKVGTGTNAQIAGYNSAGKTGTARKPDDRGGYETGAYFSSFAGFVPTEAPRLSTIVVIDEPRPTYYAGLVAAPVFARVSKYGLRLFKIPPPVHDLGVEVPDAKPTGVNRVD
jgi:cell division protein FtsI (penicillin-binding protein 3)